MMTNFMIIYFDVVSGIMGFRILMTMNVFQVKMVHSVKYLHADVCFVRKVQDNVSNNCPVSIFESVWTA